MGWWCPGPAVVSAGRGRCGRGFRSRVPAGRPWSVGSTPGSLQVGCRAVGRSSPGGEVQRSGPGSRSAGVVARGGEVAPGWMALVRPDRSTHQVRSGSNVSVMGPASAAVVSQIGDQGCRPGRSLRSPGWRVAHRSGPALGKGGRCQRSAGRQSAPGRRSLVGAGVARVRSTAGPKSAAGVDGSGRPGSSRRRRGGSESGDVGAGRRGDGSGHQAQRSGDEVAGVAAARSRRRSGGLDRRLDLGRGNRQRVGMTRTGQVGSRAEVQAGWRRAGVGARVFGSGGVLSMVGRRSRVPGQG